MIPSIEERQSRHCAGIFVITGTNYGYDVISFDDNCIFFQYDMCVRGIQRDIGCKSPCKEHITENEYLELIQKHNDNGEIRSLLIDAMRYIDNSCLSIVEEICKVTDHPIDPTDVNHRCFCREKRYPKMEGA